MLHYYIDREYILSATGSKLNKWFQARSGYKRSFREEVEADIYAAKKTSCSRMIELLRILYDNYPDKEIRSKINDRIDRLLSLKRGEKIPELINIDKILDL